MSRVTVLIQVASGPEAGHHASFFPVTVLA